MRRSVRLAAALTVIPLAACTSTAATAPGPGSLWHLAYSGYGQASVSNQGGHARITLQPARADSPQQTHAALMLSRASWANLDVQIRLRTNRQLRSQPNPWEVGWILWHYTSDQRFYYIVLKPNGWELGKTDPRYPDDQRFLATGTHPVFAPGRWYTVHVRQQDRVIQVDVDGHRLVRFADSQDPYLSGRVGLYTEDASVTFQPITVGPA